jgi:putative oxygen-independent coproporphyrinogen III oxidase
VAPISLYVHIPFCASRCGYCDFNTYTASELSGGVHQETFHEVLKKEIAFAARNLDQPTISTVFFGGGTPTLIGSGALNNILEFIGSSFPLSPQVEITTEANPDSVDARMLAELKAGGFTRISLGMQSSSTRVLQVLQRTHTPGASERAARLARDAGFDHVNMDLIYGTPGETDADVRTSVTAAVESGVDHISAYSLIVEDGTALSRRVKSGELPAPDQDVCADRYEIIDQLLCEAGMTWYEVSNWARPGGQSLHNQAYWNGSDWWGIGPGAHSHISGTRWWNHKHPSTYASALQKGSPEAGREVLSSEQRHVEWVMLGLRTRTGLDLGSLSEVEKNRCIDLAARGVLDQAALAKGIARVSDNGRLIADLAIREVLG